MQKKFITTILLCTMSLSMLGCNNDKQKQTSNDNSKKIEQNSDAINSDNNDKKGKDDATVNRTYTELPKNTEDKSEKNDAEKAAKLKKYTNEEMVAMFNERYPKMYNLFKEKLEKPYISRGENYKIREKKLQANLKGYKGIVSLDWGDCQYNYNEYNLASYSLGVDENKPDTVFCFGGSMYQKRSEEDVVKNGFKIKGTPFEDYIKIMCGENFDVDEFEKEANKHAATNKGYAKYYGRTEVSIACNLGDVRLVVSIDNL